MEKIETTATKFHNESISINLSLLKKNFKWNKKVTKCFWEIWQVVKIYRAWQSIFREKQILVWYKKTITRTIWISHHEKGEPNISNKMLGILKLVERSTVFKS